ncbi:MAG: Zn-dependent hydrolase [Lachnospiraceae bacterium]
MVTKERITNFIEEISRFTSSTDGVTRFSFTKEDMGARAYIKNIMMQIGLQVSEDGAGTIVGRLEGKNRGLPVIMLGSHFDSVGHGGKYDGVAGIATALEAVRAIREEGFVNDYPIEVVAMTEEEGIRFGVGLFGSKAMVGIDGREVLYQRKDKDGITMAEAMRSCGFDPEKFESAKRKEGSIKAFLELHIEQSIQLEEKRKDIGIVYAVAGNRHLKVKMEGSADHAGGTPMNMRKDACVAAAEAIVGIREYVSGLTPENVATVGKLELYPNVRNVIAKTASFMIDNRSTDSGKLDSTTGKLKEIVTKAARNHDCKVTIEELKKVNPVIFDERIRTIIRQEADRLGYSYMDINSGAGHDAMLMATIAPAAMIFIPCRNGKSHCPEEYSAPEQLYKGACVLYETLKRLSVEE